MVKTILIVDDESIVRTFLTNLLSGEGYKVVAATDGLDALAKIDATLPDLLITDLAMPSCDGIDLVRTVRKSPEYRALPIIMLSGSDAGSLLNALDAGANQVLQKPVNTAELLECVATWIERQ